MTLMGSKIGELALMASMMDTIVTKNDKEYQPPFNPKRIKAKKYSKIKRRRSLSNKSKRINRK